MDPRYAASVVRELSARMRGSSSLLEDAFPQQRAFLSSQSKMRAALCTRRAGKSYGIGLWLFDAALRYPGTSQLYVALTRLSAKRIMKKDIIDVLSAKYGVGVRFNEVELTATFDNGSVIYLLGADATHEEAEKVLGNKFRRAVIDEAASFRRDLHHLVYSVIRPTLIDLGGELALIGTPGNVKGFFYELTQPDTSKRPRGWDVHHWSAFDNPHVSRAFHEEIAALETENPRVRETPWFKQMYLGAWTIDSTALVYRYDEERNSIRELPETRAGAWRYIMGVDLGYNDPTAIVIVAYREHDPTLYVVDVQVERALTLSSVAERIEAFRRKYPIHAFIVDNAAKQAVEEMRDRYAIPFEAAEKTGKADAIAMLNSDLISGRMKMLAGVSDPLVTEMGQLIWDERALPRRVEHPGCANHACFVAGSMVETETGPLAIEKVRVGMRVWTREGLRRVAMTGERPSADLFELETTDGRKILGTSEHPFWTEENGWTELARLTPGSTLRVWGSTAQACVSSTTACHTAGTQSLTSVRAASTGIASAGERFIERYGRSTTAACRRAGTSKVSCAAFAASVFPPNDQTPPCAACGVTRELAERPESTTPSEHAWNAELRSCATSTASRHAAPCLVRRVSRTGREGTVFNLTIDEVPEFFVNGMLVHNCDALLYAWRHSTAYAARPAPTKPARGSLEEQEAWDDEEDRIAEIEAKRARRHVPFWER